MIFVIFRVSEEGMMVSIADAVSNKLNFSTSRDFGDFVGIEDHISCLNSLLCLESEEVEFVGIWGPSGIGKSTIARALYSRINSHFQCSIFVDRGLVDKTTDNSRRANLEDCSTKARLQAQFLSEIIGQEFIKVHHLGIVGERLKDQKVLIILDDAVDQVLLAALKGKTQWLGSGSRVIVITKDRQYLRSHGVDKIYEVVFPSKNQALKMFCRYAFGQNYPPDDFLELSTEVVDIAGNLPLGLKVFGSYVRGKEKAEWMDLLPRIRISLDGEIEEILRHAYDRLNGRDKIIFLHIACLFNKDTVQHVIQLSADRNSDVLNGLTSLAEKSLIHISEHGNIEMHHLLVAVGREVARKESIQQPGKRRFLVDSRDLCDVLEDGTVSFI